MKVVRNILLFLLCLISGCEASFAQTPVSPVQLTTNTPYLEPSTGLHWYYNGATYLWYKALGVKDSTYYITPYYFNHHTPFLSPLTFSYGFTGQPFSFNGSSAITTKVDSTVLQTIANLNPRIASYGNGHYLNLSGSNANQNIGIGNFNLTASQLSASNGVSGTNITITGGGPGVGTSLTFNSSPNSIKLRYDNGVTPSSRIQVTGATVPACPTCSSVGGNPQFNQLAYFSDLSNYQSLFAISPNQFTGSDTHRIQLAVDSASRSTGIVVIPAINNNTGASLWLLDTAVLLRSNVTINIVDTKIKRSDNNRDNFFRTDNCGFGITNILPDSNIYINGIGKVIFEGADNPRATGLGKTLYSSGASTGKSYGTDAGVSGQEQLGDWRNNGIEIAVTHNFGVNNLTFVNSQGHTVKIERSHSGNINNIIFHNPASRIIAGNSVSTLNPDGVNMYADCYGIIINGISGLTGDDMTAIGVLDSAASPHGPGEYGGSAVVTGTGYVTGQDMRYIHISNVTGHGVGLTRLINTANAKIHDIILENIIDTSSVSQVGGYIIKIGDPTGTYGPQAPIANCYNITINNIKDLNSQFCLYIGGGVDKSYFTNIRKAQTGPSAAIAFQALAFGFGPQVITDNIVYENTPLTTLTGRTVGSTLKQGIDINGSNLMVVNDAVSHRGLQYATHYNFAGLPQAIVDQQTVDSLVFRPDTGVIKQTTTHAFTSATNIENLQLGTTVPANCYLGIRITASNYAASNTYAGLLEKTYHVTIAGSAITGTSNATEIALSSMASLVNIGTPTLVGGILTFPIMANNASSRNLCFKVEVFGAPTLISSFFPLTWGTPGTGVFPGASVAGVPGAYAIGGTLGVTGATTLATATATSINKVAITAPATSATLTLANGSTLQQTGAFTLNNTLTANSTPTYPAGAGTLVYSTSLPVGANPTALIGVTAVNGSATTFMRSDAAQAADTSKLQTVLNFFPKADTRYVTLGTNQNSSGNKTNSGLWQFNNFLTGSSNIGSGAGFSFSPYINKSGTGLFGIGQNYSNGDAELDLLSFLPNPASSPAAVGGFKFLNVSSAGTVTDMLDINGGSGAGTFNGNWVPKTNFTLDIGSSLLNWRTIYAGSVALSGSTSGQININPQAAAGTYNFNLPTTAGTSGQVLTSGGGASSPMTWTTIPFTTGSDLVSQTASAGIAPSTLTANTTMRIGAYVNINSIVTDILQLQCSYTDINNNSQIAILYVPGSTAAPLSTTGDYIFPTFDIRAKSGTSVQMSALITGSGSINYDFGATFTYLR